MPDQHGQRVKDIVADALQHEGDERESFVHKACGDDSALRAEVRALLDLEPQADALFGAPTATVMPEPAVTAGRTIGGYELREVIASGGMGTVYKAVQSHPHRLVALKVLRRGAASSQAMKRFRHEVEILGRLRHPNIAQVHDAGTYDEGEGAQPYFVMELVKGQPLIQYVKQRKLGTRRRLELFLKVCDAVQYAHHKGVIHRDLKPDNILVDDSGEPKVLDFGVARSTGSDIQITTLRTDIGMLIGTVPYMSPEQVSGDPSELDTRSDVYSLGVVLYELLCGRLPHDLTNKSIPEAARVIRDEEPTPLSSIDRVFRGDLDTIVAKALEKEADRRYQTVADLAADVRRYLFDEPIAARPASTWYQLRKFARRNKPVVAAAVLATLALTGGTVLATWQAMRARAEKTKAVEIKDFLSTTLGATDFIEAGRALSVADVLGRAVDEIEDTFHHDPLAEAEVRHIIGLSYASMSQMDNARRQLRAAYELERLELGTEHPRTLGTGHDLADVLFQWKRLDDAETLFREVIDARRRTLGAEHPDTLWSQSRLAAAVGWQLKWHDAETLSRRAMDGLSKALGEGHERTIRARDGLVHPVFINGRRETAFEIARRNLELVQDGFGNEHPLTIQVMWKLGAHLCLDGQWKEGLEVYRTAFETRRRLFGDQDHITLMYMEQLGDHLYRKGETEDGIRLMRDGVAGLRRVLGNNLTTANAMVRLSDLEQDLGDLKTAVSLRREGLDIIGEFLGKEHPYTLEQCAQLAWRLKDLGPARLAEAESLARRALSEPSSIRQPNRVKFMPRIHDTLAVIMQMQGNHEEALAAFDQAEAVAREISGDDRWFTYVSVPLYGRALIELRQFDRAESLLLGVLDGYTQLEGEHLDSVRRVTDTLPALYHAWGKPQKAAEWRAKLAEMEEGSWSE